MAWQGCDSALGFGLKLEGTAATEVLGFCVSVEYAKEFLAIDYPEQAVTLGQQYWGHVEMSILADEGITLTTRVVMMLNCRNN